ncbi:eIF2B GDP-GTP exchange factor [Tieghemostelium lacteum]|uniref:Translation initiation factor eIF2B subunit delta n=1 Tax=Tieghemostelium lacteum TaxID=361077 RepID=A0A152A189_TIELA|nr:eIF2B GDP-GTP exchange factor [Tieghemostelium lacteum]|eukprot:KYQ99844.1 eIF2B GDP-GTP exchange factor [Tieghemostelium lacteum]
MSYQPTPLFREASLTNQLGEWIDEQQQKDKNKPSTRTVGFDIQKNSSQVLPSTSPSNPSFLLSKSPSLNIPTERPRSLSSSKNLPTTFGFNPITTTDTMNKSPSTSSPSTGSPSTTSVSQINNSLENLSLNNNKQQQQPQQGNKKGQQQGDKPQQQQQGNKKGQQQQQQQQGNKKEQQQQQGNKKEQQNQGEKNEKPQQQGNKKGQQQQQQGEKPPQQQQQATGKKPTSLNNSTEVENNNNVSTPLSSSGGTKKNTTIQFDDPKKKVKATKKKIINQQESQHHLTLFEHLPQFDRSQISLGVGVNAIHPYIIHLGLKYADFSISGSTARTIAMLTAFKKVIEDFQAPEDKLYSRELNEHLKPNIQFLVDCRPISISMGNSINFIKTQLANTNQMTHEEARENILETIEVYIERILFAHKIIANHGVSKINDGDVILTYASSHVVEMILEQAQSEGKKFRVIVVDSRPKHEGLELLHRLVQHNVKCTYIMLNAISYIMKEVTKVFVGAYSLLANGNCISRSGTALVASMANFYNVPFIVCSETYKFSEKAQLDSICFNQIGNPTDLLENLGEKETDCKINAENTNDFSNLKLLNLMYDVTPVELIHMVITEYGMVPPTSIPVILREYRGEVNL